jgi:hypothetical protein
MSDLMQKLAISKKIMDVHNNIQRGAASPSMPMVENFDTPAASYNIPQEYVGEIQTSKPSYDPSTPLDESRIKNSKLPDEIKRLMIEQPIVQPTSMGGGSVISDDIIEGAQRLMNMNSNVQQPQSVKESTTSKQQQPSSSNFNMNEMKSIIRDVVRDTVRDVVREELQEAGMLVESTSKSNDTLQFKVGNHVFIGKVTQVKKLK